MNIINLANIKILDNTINFEFFYMNKYIDDNTIIYFEDYNQTQYTCNIKKCKNKFEFIDSKNCEIAKVNINLEFKKYGLLKIKLKDHTGISELTILNNKNEKIYEYSNPYVIFYKKFKINISKMGFDFQEKHLGDRFRYEIKKQLYGFQKYHRLFIYRFLKFRFRKYFLFNDRLLYGDDNAEQLFNYVYHNYPDFAKNCFFVLDKDSPSINRLKKVGKVLKYGSFKHKIIFLNCKMVLSSHSSYLDNCFNPFSKIEMDIYKDLINKNFVFLQHGIVMNDVRKYLNRELTTADLFITSTKSEYKYISSDDFMYEPQMVIPTGLPRFDKLENKTSNVILLSPTWRSYDSSIKFEDSDYYKSFKSLLTNNYLLDLLKKHKYKIKFLLHPVFSNYKYLFEPFKNANIEILETSKIKYFELFNECKIFITDYSSIHFDVATLKKPIIYYQFDKIFFFSNHYQSGYFNYENDGFGKVVPTEQELLSDIEYYLNNDCKIREEYKQKIENTFIHLDHENSKRVFEEVIKLNKSNEINYRFNNVH